MRILLIIYLASGALLCALSLPLLMGMIPPNGLYGFRVLSTLNDPDLWYQVNRYAARRLLAAGVAILLAAVGLYFIPGIGVDGYALGCLGVFLLVFLPGLVQSFLYLRKLTSPHLRE